MIKRWWCGSMQAVNQEQKLNRRNREVEQRYVNVEGGEWRVVIVF
jgi:hypothetical protein